MAMTMEHLMEMTPMVKELSGISGGNGIVGGGLTGRKAIEIPAVSETSQNR